MELKILIPLIGPFITIFLAILTLPYIETYKKKLERERLLKAMNEELHDEIPTIDFALNELLPIFEISQPLLDGASYKHDTMVYPDTIKLYSLDHLLEEHFEHLTIEVRRSLKNLKATIEFLEIKKEMLHDLYTETNYNIAVTQDKKNEFVDVLFAYITFLLSYRYHVNHLIDLLNKNTSELNMYDQIEPIDRAKHQLTQMGKNSYLDILFD